MKEKKLKVYRGNGTNYEAVPQIILQGKWLSGLGFSVGDGITVVCAEDRLIITKSAGTCGQGLEREENT